MAYFVINGKKIPPRTNKIHNFDIKSPKLFSGWAQPPQACSWEGHNPLPMPHASGEGTPHSRCFWRLDSLNTLREKFLTTPLQPTGDTVATVGPPSAVTHPGICRTGRAALLSIFHLFICSPSPLIPAFPLPSGVFRGGGLRLPPPPFNRP